MKTMTRYAVQVNRKLGNGISVSYEAIGIGLSEDMQDAHLYTRRNLAQAKVDRYLASPQWYDDAFIVEVTVTGDFE